MRRSLGIVALLLAALAVQTGCGGAAHAYPAVAPASPAIAEKTPAADRPAADAPPSVAGGAPAPPSPQQQQQSRAVDPPKPDTKTAKNAGPSVRAPVIIYQGELKMMSDEEAIPKTIDRIIDVAEALGGHIASRKDTSVQIKVPSASFRDALTKIEALGAVTSRSVKADDVSEEFHDLEVRLANLRATRQRLSELMAKAGAIPDMLTVERELERVAQEIDKIEGRLAFLKTRAAMSVVDVSIAAKPKAAAPIVAVTEKKEGPAPLRTSALPIKWVDEVGIDPLLSLSK
jgi:hypothetical protein